MFIAQNINFYPDYNDINPHELSDEIILPSYYLNRIIEEFDDNDVLYVNMINTENNKQYLVTIGTSHSYDKNTIYVPQWILDLIQYTSDSIIKIKKADITDIPVANKIIIKPLDPIAFELDTRACFEKAFMNLHSICDNITIPIIIPELGNDYILFAEIVKVEPANVSLISQCEVDVEFIDEFSNIPVSTLGKEKEQEKEEQEQEQEQEQEKQEEEEQEKQEPQIDPDERRRQIRESWAKRFQNNV
jgi:hypothetical protein